MQAYGNQSSGDRAGGDQCFSPRHLSRRRGFTIVELLVVIVVIAILAAITIIAFNGVQQRARASEASAALNQAKKKLEVYRVDNSLYPTTGNLAAADVTDSSDTSYQYTSDGSVYCITATAGNVSYYASNTLAPTSGGCPGHGQNGTPAVTNLATNPSVETDMTNWVPRWFGSGAGTTAISSAAALHGANGVRKTWTTAGGNQDIGMSYKMPVTVGKSYTFSADVRSSLATQHEAFISWVDASNTQVSILHGTKVSVAANTWARLTITGTAPTGAVSGVFVWGPYPSSGTPTYTVGATIDFDGVMLTEGTSSLGYADGSSTNWVWNGTPDASTSTGPAS